MDKSSSNDKQNDVSNSIYFGSKGNSLVWAVIHGIALLDFFSLIVYYILN